ncbi:MAG: MATE family efflux transporter [archaeon]
MKKKKQVIKRKEESQKELKLDKRDLTKGSILKTLIFLSLPIILANVLQTLYNVTDTFWVGRLGANAVAAVSLSFPLIFLVTSLGGGLTMAGTILVAQYRGKKDFKNVDFISAQTIIILLFVSIILSISAYLLSDKLLTLIGATAETLPIASSYFKISSIGFTFVFGFLIIQSLLRGAGEVKMPLYIVIFTVLLNFILDPLFIFGWKFIPAMGAAGAAAATIGTQAIATILGLGLMIKGKYGIHLKKKNFKPNFKIFKKIFFLGFPSSIEQSARALGMSIRTFLFATFGTIALAAFGIGTRIFVFVFIPAMGFSMGAATMIGQNIGAGKIERTKKIIKTSIIFNIIFLGLIGLITFIFAKSLVSFFIPSDIEVIAQGTTLLRYLTISFSLIGIELTILGTFRGAGRTGVSMALSLISLWLIELPLAIILAKFTPLGLLGLLIAYPVSDLISTIVTIIVFKKVDWKSKKLIEDAKSKKSRMQEEIREECIEESPEI